MPITRNKETGLWEITDPTKEEVYSLLQIGKRVVSDGLAGRFTNEFYNRYLQKTEPDEMHSA